MPEKLLLAVNQTTVEDRYLMTSLLLIVIYKIIGYLKLLIITKMLVLEIVILTGCAAPRPLPN